MARLFAYMGNDADRVHCALHPASSMLRVGASAGATAIDSWGIGFYQGGEVLLQRRPKTPTEPLDFYAITRDLRTDAIIGHARAGTVGTPKNENTPPFRFRSWLFAHHGTVPGFEHIKNDLLHKVPDFLLRNVRGQTDSEHLFHLLLAFLHDAGKLDDSNVSTTFVRDAVRAMLTLVDHLVVAGGEAPQAECALALTNGRILLAVRRGDPVYLLQATQLRDCAVCREKTVEYGREPKRVDHEHLRSVLVVADAPPPGAPPGWQEVPDRTIVCVSHDFEVELAPLL